MTDNVSSFLSIFDDYIDSMVGGNLPSTIKEHSSKIKRFAPIFDELVEHGKIISADPHDITEREVRYFVQALRERDIAPATQQKYLQLLNCYLSHVGNNSVNIARKKLKIVVQRNPIQSLTVEDIGKIFLVIDEMKGWRGSIARGMIHMAFQTLARPTEIRTALFSDLDFTNKRFFIRNPKGAGSFATGQYVDLLRPDFFSQIDRYIAEREMYLRRKGKTSEYLFPNIYGENSTVYSSNAQREIIREVSYRADIDFSLKTFRAAGADLFITTDLTNLYAISAQLRHSNVAVTQRYYADIQRSQVRKQLGDTFERIPIPTVRKRD